MFFNKPAKVICVLQETLRIPRTPPDLLHPLPDRRSLESRTQDKQIPYPLIRLIELATPSVAVQTAGLE
jgi:hypothetical protein